MNHQIDLVDAALITTVDDMYVLRIFLVLFAAAIAFFLLRHFYKPRWKERRVREMSREEARSKLVRSAIADVIVNGLEDLEYKGILTRKEVQKWYNKFGTQLHLPDLVPRKLWTPTITDQFELKETIQARLANGFYKPVTFPDMKKKKEAQSPLDAIILKHLPA